MANPYSAIKVRGSKVLIREFKKTFRDGELAIPDISVGGREHHVVVMGPKVENLYVGDKVLITGQKNVDWAPIPNFHELLIVDEANVLLVVGHTSEYDEDLKVVTGEE